MSSPRGRKTVQVQPAAAILLEHISSITGQTQSQIITEAVMQYHATRVQELQIIEDWLNGLQAQE